MSAYPPTHRQLDALRFIEAWGKAPSLDEIAHGLGCTAKGNTHRAVSALQERGLLTRRPLAKRALEVLHPPVIPRAPDGQPLYFVRLET